MNKKQMEKKVDKIIETIRQTILDFCEYGENEDEARHYAEDCRVEIRKLVEEVERKTYERGYIDGENRKKITDRLRELL